MKHKKVIYILTIILSTILFTTIIAGLSIYTTRNILRENSIEILDLQCEKTYLEINSLLESVEQSVNTIVSETVYELTDFARFCEEPAYVQSYTEELRGLLMDAANHTKGAMSVYIRYNPDLTEPTSGIFLTRNTETGKFEEKPTLDLSTIAEEEMVWYTAPAENGEATWLGPYYNRDVQQNVISYVVPYYVNETLVGIVGMDIDCKYLKELFDDIKVYDTGYAILLAKDGQVVAHKNHELYEYLKFEQVEHLNKLMESKTAKGQYHLAEIESTVAYAATKNGMLLGILVPDREIFASSYALEFQLATLGAASLITVTVLTSLIVMSLFRLSENDELTGIYNRKYFVQTYEGMSREKLEGYALFLYDVDFFKQINDTYGHNEGDRVLRDIALYTKKLLGKKSIFARWGGDEFIGLIPAETAGYVLEELRKGVMQRGEALGIPITISIGYTEVNTALQRFEITELADRALYESKSAGKNRITYKASQNGLSDKN